MVIIIHIETEGLPINWGAPYTFTNNWPKISQISWKLYDEKKTIIDCKDYAIHIEDSSSQDKQTIDEDSSDSKKQKTRVGIKAVLLELSEKIEESLIVTAFNMAYIENCLAAEFVREGLHPTIFDRKRICIQDYSFKSYKVQEKNVDRKLKLSELHYKLFNEVYTVARDTQDDIEAIAKCFWELNKKNEIEFNLIELKLKREVQELRTKADEFLENAKEGQQKIISFIQKAVVIHRLEANLKKIGSKADFSSTLEKLKDFWNTDEAVFELNNKQAVFIEECKHSIIEEFIDMPKFQNKDDEERIKILDDFAQIALERLKNEEKNTATISLYNYYITQFHIRNIIEENDLQESNINEDLGGEETGKEKVGCLPVLMIMFLLASGMVWYL